MLPPALSAEIERRMKTMAPPVFWTPEKVQDHRAWSDAINMEFNPKPLWRRVLCSHYWVFFGGLPENALEYMSGKFKRFGCARCGASKKMREHPVNPVTY